MNTYANCSFNNQKNYSYKVHIWSKTYDLLLLSNIKFYDINYYFSIIYYFMSILVFYICSVYFFF